MKLHIGTPAGQWYTILENGNIIRDDIKGFTPSGQWKMTGLSRTDLAFGRIAVPFSVITPEWIIDHPLLYKNGNPRYTMTDLDHGTPRTHGNTKFHGVASMYFEPNDHYSKKDIVIETTLEDLREVGLPANKGKKTVKKRPTKRVARVVQEIGEAK